MARDQAQKNNSGEALRTFLIIGLVVLLFFGIRFVSRAVRWPHRHAPATILPAGVPQPVVKCHKFQRRYTERGGFQRGVSELC